MFIARGVSTVNTQVLNTRKGWRGGIAGKGEFFKPKLTELSVVSHTCNPSSWKAEAAGLLRVLGQCELHCEFQAS